jgi:hypothetical protein
MRVVQRYLKVMSSIVPMGAVGASLLLGSALPSVAAARPVALEAPVSERLTAIREAVFTVAGPGEIARHVDPNFHLTWGNRWNNWGWGGRHGGWGRPGWNNWRNGWPNWNNFWRNW